MEKALYKKKEFDKKRSYNIFWTLSDNYNANIPEINFSNLNIDFNIRYISIITTGIYLFFKEREIKDFISKIKKNNKKNLYLSLLEICFEEYIFYKLKDKRKSLKFIKEDWMEKFLNELDDISPEFSLKYLYYFSQLYPEKLSDKWEKEFLEKIYLVRNIESAGLFFNFVEKLFNDNFKEDFFYRMNLVNNGLLDINEKYKKTIKQKNTVRNSKNNLNNKYIFKEEVVDAEFNPDLDKRLFSTNHKKENNLSKNRLDKEIKEEDYSNILKYFGESIYNEKEREKINKKLCRDIHLNCKLHITKGEYSSEKSKTEIDMLIEQEKRNIDNFNINSILYKNQINILTNSIRNIIETDRNDYFISSNTGYLNSNFIWKGVFLKEENIFHKKNLPIERDIIVKILIDGSGSQFERQSQVAAQAFIVAEAFSNLNIPCSVSSFMSFTKYTIINNYRDYYDNKEKNKDIFKYVSRGMNRDGLAYRYVVDRLISRREKTKILIILSDGKPYDKILIQNHKSPISRANYFGYFAIENATKEIHKARMANILAFGIFNGYEKDLLVQRSIFGNDFAYIRDINNFAELVAKYIKYII